MSILQASPVRLSRVMDLPKNQPSNRDVEHFESLLANKNLADEAKSGNSLLGGAKGSTQGNTLSREESEETTRDLARFSDYLNSSGKGRDGEPTGRSVVDVDRHTSEDIQALYDVMKHAGQSKDGPVVFTEEQNSVIERFGLTQDEVIEMSGSDEFLVVMSGEAGEGAVEADHFVETIEGSEINVGAEINEEGGASLSLTIETNENLDAAGQKKIDDINEKLESTADMLQNGAAETTTSNLTVNSLSSAGESALHGNMNGEPEQKNTTTSSGSNRAPQGVNSKESSRESYANSDSSDPVIADGSSDWDIADVEGSDANAD